MPSITIEPDTYQRLVRRAAELHISVGDLVAPILHQLAEFEGASIAPIDLPFDQWKEKFDELLRLIESRADRYPPGFEADDSRESIYEGCGE